MNNPPAATSQLNLEDVYHTLFRHKWKILISAGLSLVGAIAVFLSMAPTYVSEARLLIRYVVDRKAVAQNASSGPESQVRSPDAGGDNIINSEIEILTSRDVAELVADAVGPDKIIPGGSQANRVAAGAVIAKGLRVEVPVRSSIIRLFFTHQDPATAQRVLQELVRVYLQKHLEIHRSVGIYEGFLSKQTDQLRARLLQTEDEIRKLKSKAGVFSMEEAQQGYSESIRRIREELFRAEAELAERRITLPPSLPAATNAAAGSNLLAAAPVQAGPASNAAPAARLAEPVTNAALAPLTREQTDLINDYSDLCSTISNMKKREGDLLLSYTEESPFIKAVRSQLAELKKRKEAMERENPSLLLTQGTPAPGQGVNDTAASNLARVMALEARIKVFNSQLEKVRGEALGADEAQGTYEQLLRKKQQEEANFKYYTETLELARMDEAIGPGRVSNISVVEAATAPSKAPGRRLKTVATILLGGLVGSLLLAFSIEFVIDQTIKRPDELERRLHLPLFMWIPDLRAGRRSRKVLKEEKERRQLAGGLSGGPLDQPPGISGTDSGTAVAPWQEGAGLRLYHEALRDRLVTYFEVRNMTHKPKLVGVTGCSKGVGVSSIATGLAAVLSEGGDGNVLLVDMNANGGTVHPLFRGKPALALADAIQTGDERSQGAPAGESLVVASLTQQDSRLPRVLPRTFAHLVPRMKASDYDYIIFDMPAVSQTSTTARLAGHMDMTLLVIEAERDHVDVIRRAAASLKEAKANVGTLLNKKRTYVPLGLIPEA